MDQRFLYRPEVLAELLRLGIRPHDRIPPARTYELLKSIYCFEIREMKLRRREVEAVFGAQPLDSYRAGLAALQDKYEVLRRPAYTWVLPSIGEGTPPG